MCFGPTTSTTNISSEYDITWVIVTMLTHMAIFMCGYVQCKYGARVGYGWRYRLWSYTKCVRYVKGDMGGVLQDGLECEL